MHSKPTVSIVITYFDYADFLKETVGSVLRQSYRDFEVLVVDDCSPGIPAQQILSDVEHPNLTVLRLEANSGPAAACNAGVRASQGQFIVALDSDDLIEESFLEKTVAVLSACNLGGVYTGVRIFGDLDLTYTPECSALAIMSGRPGPTTYLYRRAVFDSVGGYKTHVYHHDNEFWLAVLKHGWQFACVDEPLYRYRKHSAGRSRLHREEELIELVREHKDLFFAELESVVAGWEQRHWQDKDDYETLNRAFDKLSAEYHHLNREFHSLLEAHRRLISQRARDTTRARLLRIAINLPRALLSRWTAAKGDVR